MGLFGKKPVSQSDKDLASSAFADREKKHSGATNDGVENRIFGYNKVHGAETLKPVQSAGGRIEELRNIRNSRQNDNGKQVNANEQLDAAGRTAASDAISARKNLVSSDGIARRTELSAEERAEISRQGMGSLGGITNALKNKNLLTEIEGLDDTRNVDNLDRSEIDSRTAAFRNAKFFTETETDEYKRTLTAEEKLEQDLEELESAEKAISSFSNVGFRNHGVSSALEEIVEKEGGKKGGR